MHQPALARARPRTYTRRRALQAGSGALLGLALGRARASDAVLLGFDGELSVEGSTSAQSIRAGIEIAMDEINAAGGVLGGRPLQLAVRDNRTMPARSAQNLREFAAMGSLVGVFCGRYSPTVLETLPLVHELELPLFSPWASADGIIDHLHLPSHTFRLSARDSWALPLMAGHAARHGHKALGLLAVNTSWGRSSERALAAHVAAHSAKHKLMGTRWYNYTDTPAHIAAQCLELLRAQAQAILFVGNYREGAMVARAIAGLPASQRAPVLAHGGAVGGDLFGASGDAAQHVEMAVIQSFTFADARRPRAAAVRRAAEQRLADQGPRMPSANGLAQAYDLTHIVARALDQARSADRAALRQALERSRPFQGLIRDYAAPFTPGRHEALQPGDFFMAQFRPDGTLQRAR